MPTTPSSKYRPEIDGLRAFAVVAVIINHFNKDLLPSGYLGVDIFFVISGYVITSSLAGRESKNFLDFLSGFYERRIKRLVPALVVFVLITSVLICLFNPDPDLALKTGTTSLFGLSNLYLLKQSTDYFAQSTELNPFTHTWSLGVEEQFYLLFPFLIWFSGFGQQTAKGARNLFFWVGALTIASLISFIYLYQVNQPAAYFLMPPRFWEMAAGCLIFIGFQKRVRIEQALGQVPPLLVVAAMVGVMFLPVSAAVPATIGVVVLSAILIACLKKGTAAYQFFTLEKVVYVGLISYSLYLWHWSVLSISRWTIGIHWWSAPLQVGLMLLIAAGSHKWIEQPLRRKGNLARLGTLACGIITCALVAAMIKILSASSMSIFAIANPDARIYKIDYGSKSVYRLFAGTLWYEHPNPKIRRFAKCHLATSPTEEVFNNCVANHNNGDGRQAAFVFGDSHASNYAFGIKHALEDILPVYQFTIGHGCGYIDKQSAATVQGTNCIEYMHLVDDFVSRKISPGDIVFVGMSQGKYSSKESWSAISSNISDLAARLSKKNAYLMLLDDVPDLADPLTCSKKWYRPNPLGQCSKDTDQVSNDQKDLDLYAKRLNKQHKNTFYIKLRDLFCSGATKTCSNDLEGDLIYVDRGHLTVEASSLIASRVKSFVMPLVNK